MSTWGRAQDALHDMLWGYEANYGEWRPGLLYDKLTFEEVSALTEPILERIGPIFAEAGRKAAKAELLAEMSEVGISFSDPK
jgi:hypothetical protein